MKKTKEQAFSLVEILVALIAVSCISAALAPVITKKLKGNAVSVGGGGIGGGGGGGGINSDVSTQCSAINASGKCIMCNKDATICYTCTESCAENEYRNDGTCSCHVCSDFHDKCIRCGPTGCSGCSDGYGLLSGGGCEQCGNGKYVNMEGFCATCPEGYYCKGGEKTTCPLGSFSTGGASECRNCSEIAQNCVECTENGCTKCKVGYKLEGGNFCKPASSVKTFITPGNHTFQVPDTTTEITVTLVSGGAGGGAGSMREKTHTFVVSGTGNMTADDNNYVTKTSTGLYTWTVPAVVRGRNFKMTACGGGGGGGGSGGGYGSTGYSGGAGAYIQNSVLSTTDTTLTIQIGGGGGHGACDNCGNGTAGACALGGGGGASSEGSGSGGNSCQTTGNWSKGGGGGDDNGSQNGFGGFDPLFNSHGSGGAAGGSGGSSSGGKGSYLGG
ncbi:MAG: type II secretion system protein, partial [Candidatus Gastranaerophilales bacterium]|nr:type II secretion system protein [Candidatus Gastranaerophilales bacterium]